MTDSNACKYVLRIPEHAEMMSEEDAAKLQQRIEDYLNGQQRVLVLPPGFELVPLPEIR